MCMYYRQLFKQINIKPNLCQTCCPILLQSEGLADPLAKIEMPLVRVLAEMEHIRIAIDADILAVQK